MDVSHQFRAVRVDVLYDGTCSLACDNHVEFLDLLTEDETHGCTAGADSKPSSNSADHS